MGLLSEASEGRRGGRCGLAFDVEEELCLLLSFVRNPSSVLVFG